jgi:hypothetical protein
MDLSFVAVVSPVAGVQWPGIHLICRAASRSSPQGRLDLLVGNAWGGYEQHDETFGDPFWKQPVSRWDTMFTAG